jgi:hypothetical protein
VRNDLEDNEDQYSGSGYGEDDEDTHTHGKQNNNNVNINTHVEKPKHVDHYPGSGDHTDDTEPDEDEDPEDDLVVESETPITTDTNRDSQFCMAFLFPFIIIIIVSHDEKLIREESVRFFVRQRKFTTCDV